MSVFIRRASTVTANTFLVGQMRASAIALCAKYEGKSEIVTVKNKPRYRFTFIDKSHATKFVDEFNKGYNKATASKPAPAPEKKPTPKKKPTAPKLEPWQIEIRKYAGKGKSANGEVSAVLKAMGFTGTYGSREWDYWTSIR